VLEELRLDNNKLHKTFTGLSKLIIYFLAKAKSLIIRQDSVMTERLNVELKLQITLQYLATDFFQLHVQIAEDNYLQMYS
jgi:hypothetical protein